MSTPNEIKFDVSLIPSGPYCYSYQDGVRVTCPYWMKNPTRAEYENGYCVFLGRGDWQTDNLSLLWDQCKECGINWDDDLDTFHHLPDMGVEK